MTWTVIAALIVTCVAVVALIKRFETRLVLIAAGLAMCCLSLQPMVALNQFAKSMTQSSLIMAICSALGFAAVISATKCDVHLVTMLTRPLKKLGIVVLPACMVICGIVAVAVPSGAGLVAAVGPTVIPILLKAGFKPATACAAVWASLIPAYYNPGVSHNVFLAKMAGMEVMSFIELSIVPLLVLSIVSIVSVTITAVVYGDYEKGVDQSAVGESVAEQLEHVNPIYAVVPLLPVVLLVLGNTCVPVLKMGVAQAMVIGAIVALVVTRTDPQSASKTFFNGMGKGYGNILGIIIAAGVFAAGLRACGVVDLFVGYLTEANEVARLGALIGPFLLGAITGSGDAAAFAFNEAVTPHATEFGLTIPGLGMLAVLSAALGRQLSPLAGGLILSTGFANGVNPLEVTKRTAPAAIIMLIVTYFLY